VVSVPHVDYTRWGLTIAAHTTGAGKRIRWLPGHHTDAANLPADDFWMLDDDRVMFTVFEPNGRFAGGALTRDDRFVAYCRAVRDRLIGAALHRLQADRLNGHESVPAPDGHDDVP
jgi:hypothetical protein